MNERSATLGRVRAGGQCGERDHGRGKVRLPVLRDKMGDGCQLVALLGYGRFGGMRWAEDLAQDV